MKHYLQKDKQQYSVKMVTKSIESEQCQSAATHVIGH